MMKKLITLVVTLVMALTICFGMTACDMSMFEEWFGSGSSGGGNNDGGGNEHTCVAAANWSYDDEYHWKKCTDRSCDEKIGKSRHSFAQGTCACGLDLFSTTTSSSDNALALAALKEGTADVAIVDKYIADYFFTKSTGEGLAIAEIADLPSTSQAYVFLTKKDSDLTQYLNAALYQLQNDGVVDEIKNDDAKNVKLEDLAALYNLVDLLPTIEDPNFDINTPTEAGSHLQSIRTRADNTANICMAFPGQGQNRAWIEPLGWQTHAGIDGFMLYVAQAAMQALGIDVKSTASPGSNISWNQALSMINDGTCDIVCGPITADLTYVDPETGDEVAITELFDVTVGYMTNEQVIVTKAEDVADYTSVADLKNKRIVAEKYFYGETFYQDVLKDLIWAD